MKHILLTMAVLSAFSFAHAQSAQVVAKRVSGYEAYSEGDQINVYRFVGQYGGNYFAFRGDKLTIERKCNIVNGKCRGHATARSALRDYVNEGFCQRPNWTTLTCYSGVGSGDSARGDGSGVPDIRGNDGSRNPAGSGGGGAQGSGSGGNNPSGSGSGSGGGGGQGSGSGGNNPSGSASGSGGGGGQGSGSGGGGGQGLGIRTYYHDANGYYADAPEPVCEKILKSKTQEQRQGGYNSANRSCGRYWKVFEAQINVASETGCTAGKNQLRTTSGGTFSVVCTVKDAPTNDGSPSVGSLGGDEGGDKGSQSGGTSSQGGGRTGGSKGQTGGSLSTGAGGGSSDSGVSSDGKSGGQSSNTNAGGGSSDSGVSSDSKSGGQSSNTNTGDSKADNSDGELGGKDYTSILESLYDKLAEAVDAVKDGFAKLINNRGSDSVSNDSQSSISDSSGAGKADDGLKVKGKDGVKDDVKGQGTGEGESEGSDDSSAEDKENLPDDKSPEGGGEYPSNDFGKGKYVDLRSFNVTEYFSTNGTCPAPLFVDLVYLGTVEVTYDWFCRIAQMMRGVVIAFSWLAALYIIVKGES